MIKIFFEKHTSTLIHFYCTNLFIQGRLDTFLLITEVTWLLLVYVHFLSKKDDLCLVTRSTFLSLPKLMLGDKKLIISFTGY